MSDPGLMYMARPSENDATRRAAQRKANIRLAWILAAVALAFYVAFLLFGRV